MRHGRARRRGRSRPGSGRGRRSRSARWRACRRWLCRSGERFVEPQPALAEVAALEPEAPKRGADLQRRRRVPRRRATNASRHGGCRGRLRASPAISSDPTRRTTWPCEEAEVVRRVRARGRSSASPTRVERLGRVLANRLEHGEALAVGAHEALVDERADRVERLRRTRSRPRRACSRRRRRPAAGRAPARSSSSRSKLQPIVSRNARCRAGASREPEVSSSRGRSSRASIADGDSIFIRAAASSIASGRRSRWSQISARSRQLGPVGLEVRAHCARPFEEAAHGGLARERLEGELLLADDAQPSAAGDDDLQTRARSDDPPNGGRGVDDLLEVVDDQQQATARRGARRDAAPGRPRHRRARSERAMLPITRPGSRTAWSVTRTAPSANSSADRRGDSAREARLPDAARPGDREQADVVATQERPPRRRGSSRARSASSSVRRSSCHELVQALGHRERELRVVDVGIHLVHLHLRPVDEVAQGAR